MRAGSWILGTLLLVSLVVTPAVGQGDEGAVREAIEGVLAAVGAGDVDAALSFYDPECVVMPPGGEAEAGTDAIRPGVEEFLTQFDVVSEAEIQEVEVNGDLAHARMTYHDTLTSKESGETTHNMGNWLVVLRRQEDGSWKFYREIWGPEE